MIPIKFIFDSVSDTVSMPENGSITVPQYNRFSQRAEIKLMDFLTGDVEGRKLPEMWTTQKLKSWVSHLIRRKSAIVSDGVIERPEDYYRVENMYSLTPEEVSDDCSRDWEAHNNKITIVDGAEFSQRMQTNISRLKPSFYKPIAKEIGNAFEIEPKGIGAVGLEYIGYPEFGRIETKLNEEFNVQEIDEDKSINYDYPKYASEMLIWFITNEYGVMNRESDLYQMNKAEGMLVRDQRQ